MTSSGPLISISTSDNLPRKIAWGSKYLYSRLHENLRVIYVLSSIPVTYTHIKTAEPTAIIHKTKGDESISSMSNVFVRLFVFVIII